MREDLAIPNLAQNHPFRQWQVWQIPQTDWTIKGYSRSGDKTFFYVPQADIAIDAGLVEGSQASCVFLTHTHSDHSYDIEYMASKPEVRIFLPKEVAPYLDEYITARRRLNHVGNYNPALRKAHHIIGVEKDQRVYWGENDKYEVRVLACVHSIACVGFAFSEKRKRLKPEYEALKQQYLQEGKAKEFGIFIGQKKKEEVVEESYYHALWAHLGDTTTAVFAENPCLFDYPTIFTECTFLLPEHLAYAEERKHTHWELLKPIVVAHPEIQFVLIHFSLRYSEQDILQFFEGELQGIDNVKLWVSESPILPPQHQKK
jgi:ribonuclease Z